MLLVFQAATELEDEDGINASYSNTKVAILTKTQLFFLNKCSSECCKSLVNFQNSEKVDFDKFWQYSCCFYGGADFRRSLYFVVLKVNSLSVLHQVRRPCVIRVCHAHAVCSLFLCLMFSLLSWVFDVLKWPKGVLRSTGYCVPLVMMSYFIRSESRPLDGQQAERVADPRSCWSAGSVSHFASRVHLLQSAQICTLSHDEVNPRSPKLGLEDKAPIAKMAFSSGYCWDLKFSPDIPLISLYQVLPSWLSAWLFC